MAKSPAAILYDADGNPVSIVLDGATYRLQMSAKVARASDGAFVNPATQETLAAIKDTDGVKKIVDALPIGDNTIGRAKVTDGTNVLGVDAQNHAYVAGKAAPGSPLTSNPVSVAGADAGGLKRAIRTDSSGRIEVIAATVPGLAASMINLAYHETVGAIVAQQYKRVITYTVPPGYSGYLIRFTTWQAEAAYSRLVVEKQLGTLNFVTNTYTAGNAYAVPQWAPVIEAEVTTATGSANNVTVTVTYTNQDGTAGRTGTFAVPKSSIIGTRIPLVLQAGDLGVRSIQNLSAAPSGGAGAIKVLAFLQLALHFDLSATAGVSTEYAPSAISFPAGTVLGIEFMGRTVAKERFLGALIQLVS